MVNELIKYVCSIPVGEFSFEYDKSFSAKVADIQISIPIDKDVIIFFDIKTPSKLELEVEDEGFMQFRARLKDMLRKKELNEYNKVLTDIYNKLIKDDAARKG